MTTAKRNSLDSRQKYALAKEVDVLFHSSRKGTLTMSEFITEASRELGFNVTYKNVELAVRSLGQKNADVFKQRACRNLLTDMAELVKRIEALERKTDGL